MSAHEVEVEADIIEVKAAFPGMKIEYVVDGVRYSGQYNGHVPDSFHKAVVDNQKVRLIRGPTGDRTIYGWSIPARNEDGERLYCEMCGLPQWECPGGTICDNRHGGAGSLALEQARDKVPELDIIPPSLTVVQAEARGFPPGPNKNGDIIPSAKPVPGSWSDEKRQKTVQRYLAEGMELWDAINRSAWREIDDVMDAKFMQHVEKAASKFGGGHVCPDCGDYVPNEGHECDPQTRKAQS